MSALDGLFALLRDAVEGLAPVEARKMFGCPGLWADGNIFALVWKEGRVALKLPLSADELRRMPGARDWTIGAKKKMSAWVLVPEGFHDDPEALARWARRAHAEVLASAEVRAGAAAIEPAKRARRPAMGAPKRKQAAEVEGPGRRQQVPPAATNARRPKRAHR